MSFQNTLKAFAILGFIFLLGCDNSKGHAAPEGVTADSVNSSGKYFFVYAPKLFGRPVVANSCQYSAQYICHLYGKIWPGYGVGIEMRDVDHAVDGVYMDRDQDGNYTVPVFYSQNAILSSMYCYNYN
jgi:hypothetical protein